MSEAVDFHAVRDVFARAGYTDKGILDALGINDLGTIRGDDREVLLRKTEGPLPLNTLIRLFCIEASCDTADLARAVAPMSVTEWVDAGLVAVDGATARACLKILPYHDLLVGFDPAWTLLTQQARGYVMGIGSSTLTLANLTIRNRISSTLDLGTGCGFHALLASSHSVRVTGVDINPRAVSIASLNGLLNGLTNVSFAGGDLFDPVSGQTFDLIVSNPPFVISPEQTYIYRDSGMEADGITRKIVRAAPAYLNTGGFCQILCNWAETRDRDWKDRLKEWFAGTGCDAWVMRTEVRDPATYAATWIRHTERASDADFAERYDKWLRYYDEQGIISLSAGLITMRKSVKPSSWFRADEGPERMLGPAGDALALGFRLKDFLEETGDPDLLKVRCRANPDMAMDRTTVPTDEGWVDTSLSIRLNRGLCYTGNIDYFVSDLIMGCDGDAPLGELLDRMARSLKKDPSTVAPAFTPIARGLIEKGFLIPEGVCQTKAEDS